MARTEASGSFDRYENARDLLAAKPSVSRAERWSSPHTHPGGSVGRTLVTKFRVLAMFIIRRLSQGPGRKKALAGMRQLAGSAANKKVLVIGSGPSAARLSATRVAKAQAAGEVVVVATNHFLTSPLAPDITPDYVVWSDDGFHPAQQLEGDSRWETLRSHPTITVVCPWTWKKAVEESGFSGRVAYFDDDSLETWSHNISPLRPRGYQGTTGAKALALAVFLGGSAVEIIGLDLSYFKNFTVDHTNTITRHPTHLAGTDSGNQDLTPYTLLGMADLLYSAANNFRALHTHFRGHNIWNLDPDSLVDAFDKVTDSPLIDR